LKPEVIKQKNLEAKIMPLERELAVMRHPWYHLHEGAKPIDIEECELAPCCGNVSCARNLLMKASLYGGLISRDVDSMLNNLLGCCEDWCVPAEETPTWNKVLAQLPVAEVLEALKKEREEDNAEIQ